MVKKLQEATRGKSKPYKLVELPGGALEIRSAKAYLYLLPAAIILTVFVLYPLVMILRSAFFEKYVFITNTGTGFGWASFAYVLNDPNFWIATKNTAILLCIGLPITLILALGIALLLNSIKKLQGFFQTIFFLPYVTSSIAVGTAFLWLFHSQYGYMNFFLNLFGISSKEWLTNPSLVPVTLCIFCIWNGLAFKIILFLSGLQKINKQVYQASRIDGASQRKTLFRITLPLLRPTTWMVTLVSVIYVFRTFNEVYSLYTSFLGTTAGPSNSALTLMYYIYWMFYQKQRVNYAAAAALLLLLVVILITIIQRVVSKKFVHYV